MSAEKYFLQNNGVSNMHFCCSYLVVREPRQCCNAHLFCASCIDTWSSGGSDGSYLCPVCRVFGRYRPNANVRNRLAAKRVRCPESGCEWKGQLRKYSSHSRDKHTDCQMVDTASRAATDGDDETVLLAQRRRVEEMMGTLSRHLERRRRGIDSLYRQREAARREQMREVHDLSRRLGTVSTDLNQLMTNMAADSRRYRRYIHTTEHIMQSMPCLTASVEPPVIANMLRNRSGTSLSRTRPINAILRRT